MLNTMRDLFHFVVLCVVMIVSTGMRAMADADVPEKPTGIQCKVYNWASMECCWEPTNQNTGINTTTTLYWTVLPDTGYSPCPRPHPNMCQWLNSTQTLSNSYKRGFEYHLNVTVSNQLGTVTTSVSVDTKYKVMPNPVYPDVVRLNSSAVTLRWESPTHYANSYFIIYNINITSQWNQTAQYNITSNKKFVRYTLEGLVPHTNYTVLMRCIPSYNHTGVGFWSNITRKIFQTDSAVPEALPLVTPGGFFLEKSKETDEHGNQRVVVHVFWQPLPANQTFGSGVTTRVRAYVAEEGDDTLPCSNTSLVPAVEKTVRGSQASIAELYLDPVIPAYHVCVRQGNERGYNDDLLLRPLTVPTHRGFPRTRFYVEEEDNILYVKWSAVDQAVGYTVYWCQGSVSMCQTESVLQWSTAGPNDTSAQIVLNRDYSLYIVAMSTEFHDSHNTTVSTGMDFAPSVFSRHNELKSPTDLKVFSQQNPEGKSLTVEWIKPKWTDTAYIQNFLVSYCRRRHCSKTENVTVPVDRELDGSHQIYTITGLENGQDYVVKVLSVGDHGNESPYTASVRGSVFGKGWTGTQKALVIVGSIIAAMLLPATIYFIIRLCKKKCCKGPIKVVIPDIPEQQEVCMPPDPYSHASTLDDPILTGSNGGSSHESLLTNNVHCNGVSPWGQESERDPILIRQQSNVSSLGAYNIVTQNGMVAVGTRDSSSGYLPKNMFQDSTGRSSHGSSIMVYSTLCQQAEVSDVYARQADADLEPSGESDSGTQSNPHCEESCVLVANDDLVPDPEAEQQARDIEEMMAKFATPDAGRCSQVETDRCLSKSKDASAPDNNNKTEFSLTVPDQGFCDVSSSLEHMESESTAQDSDSTHSCPAESGGGDSEALVVQRKASIATDHPPPWSDSDPLDVVRDVHRTLIPPSHSYVTHKTMMVT